MKIQKTLQVNEKLFRYDLKFKNKLDFAQSVVVKNNRLEKGLSFLYDGKLPNNLIAKKLFYYGNLFIQADDYKVWKFDGLNYFPIAEPSGEVYDICLSDDGLKTFISTANGILVIGKKNFFYPGKIAKRMTFFAGKLYAINDKEVYCFDKDFANPISFYIDGIYGKLVDIGRYNGKIYLFCQKAIFTLIPKYEEINSVLEKLSYSPCEVKSNSVKEYDFGFIFAEKDCITRFENGVFKKITETNGVLDGMAVVYDKNYLIPIKKNKKSYYLCVDIEEQVFYYIDRQNATITDEGFFIDINEGDIGKLSKIGVSNKIYKATDDFENKSKKHLSLIKIDSAGKLNVKIEGESGTTSFNVNAGVSEVGLSMTSHNFDITITSPEDTFEVASISFYYRKSGR